MNSRWRRVVILWTMTIAAASCASGSPDYIDRSIQQHKSRIKSCSDSRIAVGREGLVTYTIELGSNGDGVIRCLLSGRDAIAGSQISDSQAAVVYPSPFDVITLGDGPHRQMPEVLLRTDTRVLIVSGVESDYGVTRVRHVSGNTFVVQAGNTTHDRVYLVFGDGGNVTYLTNGDVDVVDAEQFVFLVKGRKSYFNNVGGAFWFDALIDRDGNILDIVTPREKQGAANIKCMSREELIRRSSLDFGRVSSREVCVEH